MPLTLLTEKKYGLFQLIPAPSVVLTTLSQTALQHSLTDVTTNSTLSVEAQATRSVDTKAGIGSGTSVFICGTVTDISTGTKQTQQAADFPNGVPVCADESMKNWMGYAYQQQPLPTNFTGVTVQIYVLDSNNNYRQIGTATTDASGMYTLTWIPDIQGNYTVYAKFEGTNGYWPSSAESSFNVIQAPNETPSSTIAPLVAAKTSDIVIYITLSTIAIIIAIAIVGLLLLRKRT